MSKLVQIEEKDLASLFQQGVQGNSASFVLLARRLVSKLKKTDIDAAETFASLLGEQAVTREAMRPVDVDTRLGLLREEKEVVLEYSPIWTNQIASALNSVIRERKAANRLRLEGLDPIKALLLKGPPGVGKTMACRWLARELKLPLLTLDLATVMSSLLGKTGSNIRAVMDYGRSFPCVLLLDEFDSIAKKRDDDRDVGELKRLVTVLLQSIDEWPSTSLLVAATNHPELLDPAVWRRFDLQIDFKAPSLEGIKEFLAAERVDDATLSLIAPVYVGRSYADLRRSVLAARKNAILSNMRFEEALLEEGMSGENSNTESLRNLRVLRLSKDGLSQRKIAENLGISHPTVGRILKELERA